MSKQQRVSVVMCTFNGERYLRQQIDTIIRQTLTPFEIIVQDDGSTDATLSILDEYSKEHPEIKIYTNKGRHGVNSNFFSAMQRATGDYIAICDQDDIWVDNKLEKQARAIGDNMMCVCRTEPFSDEKGTLPYDHRLPNISLIRLLYASVAGHTMFFKREFLTLLPPVCDNNFYDTCYDVILATTAAAYESMVIVDETLVRQRRHDEAVSLVTHDKHRDRSTSNALYMIWWAMANYRDVKPLMKTKFMPRLKLLRDLKADTTVLRDARTIVECECEQGVMSILRQTRLYVKYRHVMFFAYERDPIALVRSLLHPLMHIYSYRYLKDN